MGLGQFVVALVVVAGVTLEVTACSDPYTSVDEVDASTADDASAARDTSTSTLDSGLVSTPGQVACDTETCDLTKGSYCCIQSSDPKYACVTGDGTCTSNRSKCDEAADCAAGESCCATLSLGSFATVCDKSCSVAQSCRTDAECGSQKCIKQRCTGLVGYLCGKNPFCEAL